MNGRVLNVAALAVVAFACGAVPASAAPATDGPGAMSHFALARKDCVGTALSDRSKVWYTVADGVLSDVYYPTNVTTNNETLQYIVTDGSKFTDLQTRDMTYTAQALDKRALEPVLIDVSSMGSYTDFIGIVSGRSDRQVDAIAENVSQVLKARGLHPLGQEGSGSGRWTLLDFGAFVIHIFYHPVREFYDLESLWIEAPRVKLDVPPEATLQQPDALYGAL